MEESPFSKPYYEKKNPSLFLCSYEKYVTRDCSKIIVIIRNCFCIRDG